MRPSSSDLENNLYGRYGMRLEEDGKWTVFDSLTPSGREARMMVGISEERARGYVERLNAISSKRHGGRS